MIFQPLDFYCNLLVKISNFESTEKNEIRLNEDEYEANYFP